MKTTLQLTLATLLLIFSCGCASIQMVWCRPNTSQAQAEHDLAEVRYDAVKFGAVNTPYNPYVNPVAAGMGDAINEAIRKSEITRAGMRAKGYRLVRRNSLNQQVALAQTRNPALPAPKAYSPSRKTTYDANGTQYLQ